MENQMEGTWLLHATELTEKEHSELVDALDFYLKNIERLHISVKDSQMSELIDEQAGTIKSLMIKLSEAEDKIPATK